MSDLALDKLTRVEELFDAGNLDEAIEILENLDQFEELDHRQKAYYQFLKGIMLSYQTKVQDVIKLGRKMFKEGKKLGENAQAIDGLSLITSGLIEINQFDEAFEVIQNAEDLLKSTSQISQKDLMQKKAYVNVLKGIINLNKGNIELAKKCFEWVISLENELGITIPIVWAHLQMAGVLSNFKKKVDLGFKYGKKALSIAKEMRFNHFWVAMSHLFLGSLYSAVGEFNLSLDHSMESVKLFEKINSKIWVASIKNNIGYINGIMGNYNLAMKFLEESLALWEETPLNIEGLLDSLIFVALEMGDEVHVKKYFQRLEDLYKKKTNKHIDDLYQYNKALLLKRSSRIRDKVKAEELFKQVLERKPAYFDIIKNILINLCDILLTELRVSNNVEVLDELNEYISQLLTIAEKSRSYLIFCETFILQAKLALLKLDVKAARRFLTQAQKIAESYGIKRLAMKISYEHDELIRQSKMWENLKGSETPLSERMKLAGLNEQMEGLLRGQGSKLPKLNAEQPVLLTVMSKEGNIILSNPFSADLKIDSTFFSTFLSSCSTFCDQILSESFDRVNFGQHTVLITAVNSFSICYMFQGQSYSARQKLLHFSEAVKKELDIMKILEDSSNKNVEIKVNEIASLEELIYESFLSDPEQFQMPFKAYEGDEPFVFVSYSHTDRLQVYPIIDYLNKTSKNIWYDEGIPISEDWKKSIVDNLERCSAFLVFITPHIIDSEYVRKEISFALKKHKPFFSVYLKETELPSELEFEIGNIQFMKKYLLHEGEFYDKLNRMLNPVLNK
ncbi:MAG: TIR domain-containing protein [Promethearchaeota archaeon]